MEVNAVDKLSERLNAKYKQDRSIPFLINIHDGRLVPNNVNTAAEPEYRPYGGPLDASPAERLKYAQGIASTGRLRVVNTAPEREAVDIGKMDKEQLANFAAEEFGMALDVKQDVRNLRKLVLAAANGSASTDDMS